MANSFELQTLADGIWRIESIYGDRAAAIADAQRLHARAPTLSVRVVDNGETSSPDLRARVRTVFEAAPFVPVGVPNQAAAAPLSGRRRDEIERHNEEMRQRRLFRQRIVAKVQTQQKRLDDAVKMLTWRAAALAALAGLIVGGSALLLR
jgi:ElaB/YqjD/DUF883 family membrane-anchored ribosome-binding protein